MQKIVIIGKKNVGKSSLFNLLTKTKNSISINYHGYTRDCNSSITKLKSSMYEIIDTAGLGYEKNELDLITLKHTWQVIKTSHIIILLMDATDIINKINLNIINIIKKLKQKKIYTINKIDLNKENIDKIKFIKPLMISVKKNIGIENLITEIHSCENKEFKKNITTQKNFQISIIGRPNVGKSSLINTLTTSNKLITYNESGTTRDNIYINFQKNEKQYTIIDTPGIKKKNI